MFRKSKIKKEFAIVTTQKMMDSTYPVTVFYSGDYKFNVYIECAKRYQKEKDAIKRASQLQKHLGGTYLVQVIV